jgi:hypothetical protein
MDLPSIGGINTPAAWSISTGNPHSIIAVLDTGLYPNDSLTPNIYPLAVTFNNGTATVGSNLPSCSLLDCPITFHGTHISGTIAASGTLAYGKQIYGVGPTNKVLNINVFVKLTGPENCGANVNNCITSYIGDIYNALGWLAATRFANLPAAPLVTAINMSFGSSIEDNLSCSENWQSLITALHNRNITLVAAAGNSSKDASGITPANCPGVITVAATGPSNLKARYSNYGPVISITAPGGDSSIIGGKSIYSTTSGGYIGAEGTSMAAPHVAGLIGLLYAIDPTLTPAQVLTILQTPANVTTFSSYGGSFPFYFKCDSTTGATYYCGPGIINAGATATYVNSFTKPTLQWTPNFQVSVTDAQTALLSWSAANWSNVSNTPIIYSVTVDGTAIGTCQNITALTCTLGNLGSNGTHSYSVSITDQRQIFTPTVNGGSFTMQLVAPTLTTASRNPQQTNEAWLAYSQLGSVLPGNSYTINGVSGVSVSLDTGNQRFIVNGLSNRSASVSITLNNSPLPPATSNTIFIPSTGIIAPTLTTAIRNPNVPSQAWLAYSDLGTDDPANVYSVIGLSGASITLDKNNQRFVIDNITSQASANVRIDVQNTSYGEAQSNQVSIPSWSFTPPTLSSAKRNPMNLTEGWLYYSSLGTDDSGNVYSVEGLSAGATVQVDRINQRFILSGITTGKAHDVNIEVNNTVYGQTQSNLITLPGILGNGK